MTETTETTQAKGILVFYVSVGMLPPFKAEAYLERLKDQYLLKSGKNSLASQLPQDITTVFIPVRPPQETKIDYIPLDLASKDALDRLKAITAEMTEFLNENFVEEDDDEDDGPCGEHCGCHGVELELPKKNWCQRTWDWFRGR